MLKKRVAKSIIYSVLAISSVGLLLKNYLYSSKDSTLQLPQKVKLQEGDVILRRETNHISDMFANINNSEYSHIGTLVLFDDKINVVHIEDNGEKEDFHIVAIKSFLQYASKYAIYRPKEKIDTKKLHAAVEKIRKTKPKFDIDFSGKDDNAIYCTELTYILNRESTSFDLHPRLSHYLDYRFISIDTFTDNRYFSLLYRSK